MNHLISSYLQHIGFTGTAKADLETLTKLHYLHTLAIPFENLNPFLDVPVALDVESLVQKFIVDKRGGYCFEQNTLFLEVLKAIGFKAKGLGARVIFNQAEDLITRRSHMLLAIELDQQTYLADVGFGGMTLTTPLMLKLDIDHTTTHEDFRIEKIENDLKLRTKIKDEWKTLYRFDLQEQFSPDYEVINYYLSTHPTSPFKTGLIAAKPTKEGRLALRNNQFTIHTLGSESKTVVLKTAQEIKDVLTNSFGIRLPIHPGLESRLQMVIGL